MMRAFVVVLWMAAAGGMAPAALGERVLLRGGAVVEAPVLKRDDRLLALDLGHDVLRIPMAEVLRIESDAEAAGTEDLPPAAALYPVADRLRTPTSAAVELFGPAVVVVKSPGGQGSGFFVAKDGYLLTNFHVIAGQRSLTVTRLRREAGIRQRVVHRDVEIVAVAPFHDLAVLRVKDLDEAAVTVVFPPANDVRAGDTVFAIGTPLGLDQTVTEGVLSQTARNFGGLLFLQFDAPANPGNSGGPLFNDRGQVIGVINMKVPAMEGLNFAIPLRHVRYLLDHLDAFAYDESNSESGYVYPAPPGLPGKHRAGCLEPEAAKPEGDP